MKTLLILFYIATIIACKNDDGNTAAVTDPVTKTNTDTTRDNRIDQQKDVYSIVAGNDTIFLQQWDSTINLEKAAGPLVKTKTKQLDRNSDTFAGSFIKDLEFPGLKLKLFSPRQNGKTFWIQEIILTDARYKTTKGVAIGDTLEKVKQAYPTLKLFPGNSPNMYWVANEGYEKSIEMEFEKNKLVKLRMYYMMN